MLLGLSAAIVGLQLLILWRFAALGASAAAGSAAALLLHQPPQPALDLGSGSPSGGQAAQDGAWATRLQLLAGDVDVMRRRLELLAGNIAAAAAAAPVSTCTVDAAGA